MASPDSNVKTLEMQLPGAILSQRIIPVARGLDATTSPPLLEALISGGLSVIEVTLETQGGLNAIAALAGSGATVGAGTVMSVADAAAARQAGATFVVTPHTSPELIRWATRESMAIIAGAFTPTEIRLCIESGAAAVKLFPASIAGPDLVATLRGPFPHVAFIPTGGITGTEACAYLEAGATAVGVGGWLTSGKDLRRVTDRAAELVAAVGALSTSSLTRVLRDS